MPKPPRATPAPAGRFIEFDQRGYIPQTGFFSYLWGTGLDKTGWLYVPPACEAGERCRLHVVFHGCKQGQSFLPLRRPPDGGLYNGTTFVRPTASSSVLVKPVTCLPRSMTNRYRRN